MAGDPIRVLTILACAITLVEALRDIRKNRGFVPRHVFTAAWCAHVLVFYSVYIISARWQPPFNSLQSWWPPVIVTHAALSLMALQLWKYTGGGRKDAA